MKVKYILIFTVFLLVDQVGFAQNYKPAVKDVISPKTRYLVFRMPVFSTALSCMR